MNARTDAMALAVEMLPLTAIAVSETQAQGIRRKKYDAEALRQLADTIKEQGVLMPVVVRPLSALRGLAKYELVAGERRWLASQMAGVAHLPARILELTDAQVLKAQLVENLHREQLDVLAEAQGYKELIDSGMRADAIGDVIGRSRSYVYARIQLLGLAPAIQEAIKAGEIDSSQALLFSRLPVALQDKALKTLRNWAYQGHGERLSFRRTAEIVRDKTNFIIPLTQVPWSLEDTSFHTFGPKTTRGEEVLPLPACTGCPKRSGNDPELLAALEDENCCTDKECHDVKAKQTFERRRAALKQTGKEVLTGDAAAAILPTQYGTRGYFDLDAPCEDDEYHEAEPEQGPDESDEAFEVRFSDWDNRASKYESRTYRQILGDDVAKLEIKIVQDPKKKSLLRELAPDKDVAKLLKSKGIDARGYRDTSAPAKPEKPVDPEKARRQAEKAEEERVKAELDQKVEAEANQRLVKQVFEKWKGPLKRDDLELVLEYVFDSDYDARHSARDLLGKNPTPASMNERDLGRLILVCIALEAMDRDDGIQLRALAKRLKLDPKAIEKEVRAELTTGAQPKATKKGAKK